MVSIASLADSIQHLQFFFAKSIYNYTKLIEFKIYNYIEELKSSSDGWKKCIEDIAGGSCNYEQHFLLLHVIEEYLMTRYAKDDEGQIIIRNWMCGWLQFLNSSQNPPLYLVKKMACLFALVFVADFPSRWPNYMEEVFYGQVAPSSNVTVFFLHTLLAIDSEVVDHNIPRTKQILERNARIKDAMRANCNTRLAMIWTQILAENVDVKVAKLCLDVIACYIHWIDLTLVVNDTTIPLIINCLSNRPICDSALSAINAIVEKGMEAEKKFSITAKLNVIMEENGFFTLQGDCGDDVSRAASLIRSLGTALTDCYFSFMETGDKRNSLQCVELIEKQANIALFCLSNEVLDVSKIVIDFLRRYIRVLKTQTVNRRHGFAVRLISVVLDRYKAPIHIDMSCPNDEYEAVFLEYRKQLRIIMIAIGNFEQGTILSKLEPLVGNVCENWKRCDLITIEATLALVYDLADFFCINFKSENTDVFDRVKAVVILVVQSTITHCKVPVINELYFEIVCRYNKILHKSVEPLPVILEAFLDTRGLYQNPSQRRGRIIYLFFRFIKAHKLWVGDRVSLILPQLNPLFKETSEEIYQLTKEDKIYLYEATALIIIHSNLPIEKKEEYMKVLGLTLLQKFMCITKRMSEACIAAEIEELHNQRVNVITCSVRITKPVIGANMQNCLCKMIFTELMKAFLEGVVPKTVEELEALKQYFHGMVICLDRELLAALPSICDKFLVATANSNVIHDFFILLQQVFNKFRGHILEIDLNVPALFDILWALQRMPVNPLDESSVKDLIRCNQTFLQTLLSILANDLTVLLTKFGDEFLGKIAESVFASVNANDVKTQRIALHVVSKLFLGLLKGQPNAFIHFLWEKAVERVLQAPLSDKHDPSTQEHLLLQHEMYGCLESLRTHSPERFDVCLHALFPTNAARSFSQYMLNFKNKQLITALDALYIKLRYLKLNNVEY